MISFPSFKLNGLSVLLDEDKKMKERKKGQ